jgi:hypothetical protein
MEASRKMFNKAIFISYTLQLNYYSVIVNQMCDLSWGRNSESFEAAQICSSILFY